MPYCPKCGNEILASAAFCGSCGKQLPSCSSIASDKEPSARPKLSNRRRAVIAASLGIVAVAAVAALIFFGPEKGTWIMTKEVLYPMTVAHQETVYEINEHGDMVKESVFQDNQLAYTTNYRRNNNGSILSSTPISQYGSSNTYRCENQFKNDQQVVKETFMNEQGEYIYEQLFSYHNNGSLETREFSASAGTTASIATFSDKGFLLSGSTRDNTGETVTDYTYEWEYDFFGKPLKCTVWMRDKELPNLVLDVNTDEHGNIVSFSIPYNPTNPNLAPLTEYDIIDPGEDYIIWQAEYAYVEDPSPYARANGHLVSPPMFFGD